MFVTRDVFQNVKSTGESFKSWNTCMANTACKVIAIVGIVLASLIVLWILTTIFRCCFYGLACGEACCSCFTCCCRGSKSQSYQQQIPVNPEKVHPYENYNMYPPHHRQQNMMYMSQQYNQPQPNLHDTTHNQPQQAYFPQSNYRGYEPVETDDYPKSGYRSNL